MIKPFSPLSYYNASIRWNGCEEAKVSEAEVLLPDGRIAKFERRDCRHGYGLEQYHYVTYMLDTATGPALFASFDDLMQRGLGFTKIENGPKVACFNY